MTDLPIVDTHMHLWDPDRISYPWLGDNALLSRPYLPNDYRAACGEHAVEKMVFVECGCDESQIVDEASWIASLVEQDPRISGIVAGARVDQGDTWPALLDSLSQNALVRGVRHNVESEPDPAYCVQPAFIEGVQRLGRYGLSFDICCMHLQLKNAVKLVQSCPDVSFILDHIAKPDIAAGLLDPWRADMQSMAQLPNVVCKVSGIITEADHANWKPSDVRPYIDHVLTTFGFDRVMFGGDWPVVLLAGQLHQWMTVLKEAVADCSADEQRRLFGENAKTVYRLV